MKITRDLVMGPNLGTSIVPLLVHGAGRIVPLGSHVRVLLTRDNSIALIQYPDPGVEPLPWSDGLPVFAWCALDELETE